MHIVADVALHRRRDLAPAHFGTRSEVLTSDVLVFVIEVGS